MKKLILLALIAIVMAGCDHKNPDGTYTTDYSVRVYILDSCEYYGVLDMGNANYLSHKGNCRFCKERRKKELEKLVIRLKEK